MNIETEGAGKGDTPRQVDGEKFRANYDRIFKRRSVMDRIAERCKEQGFDPYEAEDKKHDD